MDPKMPTKATPMPPQKSMPMPMPMKDTPKKMPKGK